MPRGRYADEIHRIGAQHSSYVTAAKLAGCRVREGHAPKHWRFKSAASWLHGKVLQQLRGEAHRKAHGTGQAESTASPSTAIDRDLRCSSSLGPMINSTPCATPCLVTCRDAIHRAYA